MWFSKLIHHNNFGIFEDKNATIIDHFWRKKFETTFCQQGILNQILGKYYTMYLHRFINNNSWIILNTFLIAFGGLSERFIAY